MLIAPGSVIQDACRNGKFFGARFNPADPPEFVKCFGGHWRSEGEMQKMTIANEIKDALAIWEYAKALPYVSEKYMETYGDRSELIIIKGGNHMITRRKKAIVAHAVAFFDGLF